MDNCIRNTHFTLQRSLVTERTAMSCKCALPNKRCTGFCCDCCANMQMLKVKCVSLNDASLVQARGGPAGIASADMGCINKMQIHTTNLVHKTARRVMLHNVQELWALSWTYVWWCLQALCSNQLTAVTTLLLVPVPAALQLVSQTSHMCPKVSWQLAARCLRALRYSVSGLIQRVFESIVRSLQRTDCVWGVWQGGVKVIDALCVDCLLKQLQPANPCQQL